MEVGKGSPRVSLSCGVPFSPMRSPTYNKLPQVPIKLTVLKLDGTTFEIYVAGNGTVAELKKAVEAAFSHLPKSGPGRVSWAYMWGRFCLSFDGEKLLADLDCIGNYGIRDGDQLEFVRHVSVLYLEKRVRPERGGAKLDDLSDGDGQLKCKGGDNKSIMGKVVDKRRVTAVSNCQCSSLLVLRKWLSYLRISRATMPKRPRIL